jgi:hypothetical protein
MKLLLIEVLTVIANTIKSKWLDEKLEEMEQALTAK